MGIIAGKIITGGSVIAERVIADSQPRNTTQMKSLSELRRDEQGGSLTESADKRLSSYFLIKKESDYLDHNIKNNRR